MAFLVLPIIIASQEALRAVPNSIQEGAYALGASRWQVTSRQVLPVAFPGIFTGIILAPSRAMAARPVAHKGWPRPRRSS
jgi:phosphate transport system permease protein